jgi:hypothetical protein
MAHAATDRESMHCPNCKQRAISFISWASGRRWARYRCPHCGTPLKVGRRTIKTILISILVGLPLVCLCMDPVLKALHVQDDGLQRIVAAMLICVLLAPAAFWDWKSGFYAQAGPPTKANRRDKELLESNS